MPLDDKPLNDKPTVLIVDDISTNIDVLVETLEDQYEILVALDGETALETALEDLPDIILLDIMMPEMDGYEVCRRLKADARTADIPVIFVTAMDDVGNETKGLSLGAIDYITKPISPDMVRVRVANHLHLAQQHRMCRNQVEEQVHEIRRGQTDAIHMLGLAGHYNDDDTGVHIWRMANYAKRLAKEIGWSVDMQEMLVLAAPMHDTGKIGIPDSILKKPGKLDESEWVIMKKHTVYGHKILSVATSPLFDMAGAIALYHHERWAGGGYPENLEGEAIPEAARIVAVADVFDALTMKRPYKEEWPVARALEYIRDSGGHFEPRLAEAFCAAEKDIVDIKTHWSDREKGLSS
ncbi:response regulator [Pseudodesulfovibrio thermohalotolerans]|uniref:response regulator n=1 Tax=Pseudodesulfovibrio thermohalotolerans TaxID=2880651 RepID=UPI002441A819|nr:HD domain-containing phosphohydrolase [Pseudodesulfovibrio thermohalotolerans]WFS62759.1 response regulator [Pseudodesulfovibrio thermohalotolerans]